MSHGGSPPGWYPDPWQQAPFRWWDGAAWTPHVTPPAVAPGPGGLRDEDGPARLAQTFLLVAAGAQILGWVIFRHVLRDIFDQLRDFDSSGSFSASFGLPAQLPSLVTIGAGVAFLVWFARSADNARVLGLPARRDTAMGVVGFIVPVINLWWPYQSVSDLLPSDDPHRPHVLRWFLLWVVGGAVSAVVGIASLWVSGWVGWALLVIPAVQVTLAALAACQVVGDVVKAHAALAARPYGSNR